MKLFIKRMLCVLSVVIIMFSISSTDCFSDDANIKVYVNNNELKFDVPPITVDGRTLVPVRALLEKLGATVQWNENTNTVTAIKGNETIKLQLDSKTAYINGKSIELDVPLMAINGRTLIPLRFISENLGTKVKWDESSKSISISDKSSNNEISDVPKDKVRNGYDKYTWGNGTTYEGEWSNNKVNGHGTLTYANGDTYSGSFIDNKKDGYGTYTWVNDESYLGNWTNDKMSGNGTYFYKNRDSYVGNWNNGKMEGQGTYRYSNGSTLTGLWVDNKYISSK